MVDYQISKNLTENDLNLIRQLEEKLQVILIAYEKNEKNNVKESNAL